MRLLIRTSKWAIWARRLAIFVVPVLALSVWLHRKGVIPSDTFTMFLSATSILALVALVTSFIAMARIWQTGDRGWNQSLTGMILALIALTPLLLAIPKYQRFPALTDITTDIEDAPSLASAPVKSGLTQWQNSAYAGQVAKAFPSLGTRIYAMVPQDSWVEIEALADEQSWRITHKLEPQDRFSTGQLSAVVHSLFGFYDDLTIRVEPDIDGVRVDMRSASRYGDHDLGKNGQRIEKFLLALDARIEKAQQRAATLAE